MKKIKFILVLGLLVVSVLSFSACGLGIKKLDIEDIYKTPVKTEALTKAEKFELDFPKYVMPQSYEWKGGKKTDTNDNIATSTYKYVTPYGKTFTFTGSVNTNTGDGNIFAGTYNRLWSFDKSITYLRLVETTTKDGVASYKTYFIAEKAKSNDDIIKVDKSYSIIEQGEFIRIENDFYTIEDGLFVKQLALSFDSEIINDLSYIDQKCGDYYLRYDGGSITIYDKTMKIIARRQFPSYELIQQDSVIFLGLDKVLFQTKTYQPVGSDDYNVVDEGNKVNYKTYELSVENKLKEIDFDYVIDYVYTTGELDIEGVKYVGGANLYPIEDERVIESRPDKSINILIDKEGKFYRVKDLIDNQTSIVPLVNGNFRVENVFNERFIVNSEGEIVMDFYSKGWIEHNDFYALDENNKILYNYNGEKYDLLVEDKEIQDCKLFDNSLLVMYRGNVEFDVEGEKHEKTRVEAYIFKDGSLTPTLVGVKDIVSGGDEEYDESTYDTIDIAEYFNAIIVKSTNDDGFTVYTVVNEYFDTIISFADTAEIDYSVELEESFYSLGLILRVENGTDIEYYSIK